VVDGAVVVGVDGVVAVAGAVVVVLGDVVEVVPPDDVVTSRETGVVGRGVGPTGVVTGSPAITSPPSEQAGRASSVAAKSSVWTGFRTARTVPVAYSRWTSPHSDDQCSLLPRRDRCFVNLGERHRTSAAEEWDSSEVKRAEESFCLRREAEQGARPPG